MGDPARPARHPRPDRQRGRELRVGPALAPGDVRRRRLRGLRHRDVRRLPGAAPVRRAAEPAALLPRRVAGDRAGLRVAQLGGHDARHAARGDRAAGRPAGVRRVRRTVRRHDEDGRLRGRLPGARGDLRGAGLRRVARPGGLRPDRVRVRRRLGRDGRADGRDRHAHADPVDARAPARGRRPAARHRPDPRHDAHGDERRPARRSCRSSSPAAKGCSTSGSTTRRRSRSALRRLRPWGASRATRVAARASGRAPRRA